MSANKQSLYDAHIKAAQYYEQRYSVLIERKRPNTLNEQLGSNTGNIQPLVEAVWHLCQAEQWLKAYDCIQKKGVFTILSRLGVYETLSEMYRPFLPTERWQLQPEYEANIYNDFANICYHLDDKQAALKYYNLALSLRSTLKDQKITGTTLCGLGEVYESLGGQERQQALEFYTQAIQVFEETNSLEEEEQVLNTIASLYKVVDDLVNAKKSLDKAREIAHLLAEKKEK